jgi:SAM-dependent methyltransferase
VIHRVCPFCGQDNAARPPTRLSTGPWQVKRCAGCRFVYLENAPTYDSLSEDHAWEKTSKIETLRKAQERPFQQTLSRATRFRLFLPQRQNVLSLLARHAPDGPVVDIGCGNAGYMQQLHPRHRPCGIEISREMAAVAQRNLDAQDGVVVHAPALEGLQRLPAGECAAVVMRSYLEHELKPQEVLAAARRVLKAGGLLVLKLPNYGSVNAAVMGRHWCGVRLPDHMNYFTPRHLAAMVRRAGLEVFRFGFLRFRPPTSDNMWMLARRPPAPPCP